MLTSPHFASPTQGTDVPMGYPITYCWSRVPEATSYILRVLYWPNGTFGPNDYVVVGEFPTTDPWITMPAPTSTGWYTCSAAATDGISTVWSGLVFFSINDNIPYISTNNIHIDEKPTKPIHFLVADVTWDMNGASLIDGGFVVNGDMVWVSPSGSRFEHIIQGTDTLGGENYTVTPFVRYGSGAWKYGATTIVHGGEIIDIN